MKSDGIFNHVMATAHDSPAVRPRTKLEILTADNVEPALEAMLSSMDRLDERVRLVAERDGMVLAAGHSLAAWLKNSDCLILRAGRLQATTRPSQLKLNLLFNVAAGNIETQVLSRGPSSGHCILRCAGLCDEIIAITMQMAHGGFEPKLADLEAAFGLTPSEAHIVELLQQGYGPQEIGERLCISVHTVRAHLRHCYDKLDVSTREELWQKLAPYRLN